jgi:hypothetical protein
MNSASLRLDGADDDDEGGSAAGSADS